MSAPYDIPPDVAKIAAPLLLGTVWNWTLYGALVVQTYVYSYNFQDDRLPLKLLVLAVFLLETLQTTLSGTDLYHWFVSGFGNMDRLNAPHLSAFDVPIIGSVVSLVVQFFFVFRIWVLSRKTSWPLCFTICLVSTLDAIAAFGGGVYAHLHGRFITGLGLKIVALTWLGGNTLADLLITGSMLYYLRRPRYVGDGHFSEYALSKIVRLTIETNIMTTTVGIVSLLMVSVYPNENWYTCPISILGKLYSNTLLVSLNNRISIRKASAFEAEVGPPAVTVPITFSPRVPSGIVRVELDEPEAALTAWPSPDSAGKDSGSRVFDIA